MPNRATTDLLVGIAVATSLVLGSAACTKTTTPQASSPTSSTSGASAEQPTPPSATPTSSLDWSPCDSGYECATLDVPIDYADPSGPTTELALSRQVAGSRSERIGSLLMNPGGPGASGIDYLQAGQITGDLEERFDLVSWDPRGIGRSSPLACNDEFDHLGFRELDSDPDTEEEVFQIDAAGEELAALCAESDLPLLEHLDTPTNARDLNSIREALGDPKLNYIGFSYGTAIGQEYARLFPDKVRAITLDGVVDPSISLQEMLRGQAVTIESTFSASTLAEYDLLMAQVEETPLEGVTLDELGPGMVALAAVAASYYPSGESILVEAIDLALDGDGSGIEELALSYVDASTSFAGYAGVVCIDSPMERGADAWMAFADELERVAPRFGAAVANELIACAYWPVASLPQPTLVSDATLPPILVIGNTGDAATPYENAEKVAAALPGAVLLTLDDVGHTALGKSPCIDAAVEDYFIDLEPPATGTVCN